MITGAVFDVDGTLLDSMSIWDTIGEDYLRSIGYIPRENLNEVFKDMSLQQAARYYQTEYGVTLSMEEIMDGVNSLLERFYREQAPLKPGAGEFVRELSRRGVKLCVATATERPLVEAALARCGVLGYFEDILTCTTVGRGKDEPLIYREALKRLGGEQPSTLVFEDALYATRTAKADGFPVAAVYDSHEKWQEELKALADIYLTDFSDFDSFWTLASSAQAPYRSFPPAAEIRSFHCASSPHKA